MQNPSDYLGRLHLFVELQESEKVTALKQEIAMLKVELSAAEEGRKYAERRFGEEVYINSELIDLLREHGIQYRVGLDAKTRR